MVFGLCRVGVGLIGNYIFVFNNEEVWIFRLKEYGMKRNNSVIGEIVRDIEIEKWRKVKSGLGKVGGIMLCLVDVFGGGLMGKWVGKFLGGSEIVVICIFGVLVVLVYWWKIKIEGVYVCNDLGRKIWKFKVKRGKNK